MELRIAIRIFDDREQKHLSHILAHAARRGEVPVLTAPAAQADVIFIKPDEPGAAVFLQPGRRGTRPIAVAYDTERPDHPWFLAKPATSTDLIPLLRQLQEAAAALPRAPVTAPAAETAPAAPGPARGDATASVPAQAAQANATAAASADPGLAPLAPTHQGQALLERLRDCAHDGLVCALELDLRNVLVLDGRRRLVHLPATYADPTAGLLDLVAAFGHDDFQPLSDAALAELLDSQHCTSMPLEQFTWAAGHHLEPRLPLPAEFGQVAFRLKRWPTFTRLRYRPVHMQWAGRLVQTAHSLAHLGTDPAGSAQEAAKFYNACVAGGLAILEAGAPLPALAGAGVAASGERQGIFQRILKRLLK